MSKFRRRPDGWMIAILALAAIGLVYGLIESPTVFIIPIVVLGGIFLLYKYPPSFLRNYGGASQKKPEVKQSRPTTAARTRANRTRTKPMPFRVIEGGKDDNDQPRYH